MKNKRIFLKELDSSINKMELLKYFSDKKDLRTRLFKQYISTEAEPDLSLYLKSHLTKIEWDGEIIKSHKDTPFSKTSIADFMPVSDFEKKAKVIENEFYKLLDEKKLPENYYTHSIKETVIYRVLSLVHLSIEDFKKRIIDSKDFNLKEYAEMFATDLINRIEEFEDPELTNVILKDFVSDNENSHIDAVYIVSGILRQKEAIPENEIRTQYRELKRYADNVINEYLEKQDFKEFETENFQHFPTKNKVDPKTYKYLWFESGLMFANGTMDKYWNENQNGIKEPYSAPDIVRENNLPTSAREYILAVFNNYGKDKNLFNYPHKIKTILDYCERKNIAVSDIFIKKQAEKMNEYK